ncbi:MAG: hypothetical protein JXR63_03630 [Spirochaetales bacterium]|nr:hypothetical protein [Spirochaetales bacterium]
MNIAFQIVVSILILVLFVFRFLDKNNRSLEKIKRYSEKIKNELDIFVGQRSEDLKNIGVEVDVHQKASKEIIKKIETFELRLKEKNETLENVFSRIEDYDKAIKDLVSMTERVDENLLRLKDESLFVEQVAMKLSKVKTEMDSIERSIPEIQNEFNSKNVESAQQLIKELEGFVREQLDEIETKMDSVKYSVGEFSDFVQHLEEKKSDMENSATAEFQSAIDSIYDRTENKFDDLKSEIDSNIETLFESLNAKTQEVHTLFAEKNTQFSENMGKFTTDYKSIEADFRGLISEADKALTNGTKNLKTLIDKSDAASLKMSENFSTIDRLNADFQKFSELISEYDQKFLTYSEKFALIEKNIKIIDANSDKLEVLNKDFVALEKKLPKLLDEFSQKDREILEGIATGIKSEIENDFSRISKGVEVASKLADEYCSKISRSYVQVESDVSQLSLRLQSELQELVGKAELEKNNFLSSITNLKSDVDSVYSMKVDSFAKEVDDILVTGKSNFAEIYNEVRASYGDFVSADIAKIDDARNSLLSSVEQSNQKISAQVRSSSEVIAETLVSARGDFAQIKDEYQSFSDNISKSIDASKHDLIDLNNQSSQIREDLTLKAQEVSNIYTQIQEYDASISELKDLYNQTNANIAKLKEDSAFVEKTHKDLGLFAGQLASFENSISSISANFESLNRESLERLLGESQQRLEELFAGFYSKVQDADKTVSEFNTFTNRFLSEKDKYIADSVNQISEGSLKIFETADLKNSEMLKGISDRAETLYSELDAMLSNVKADLASGTNSYNELRSRIDQSVEVASQRIDNFFTKVNNDVITKEGEITALFSRAESVKAEIDSRSETIEQMYEKINSYGVMIDELNSLSSETAQRLNYLKSEAGFVNSVSKKLKGISHSVGKIEKEIPELKEKFSIENQQQIQQVWGEAKGQIDSDVDNLSKYVANLEGSVEGFSEFIKSLEARRDSMRVESENQSKEIFDKLLRDTNERFESFSSDFNQRVEAKEGEFVASFNKISGDISVTIDEAGKSFLAQEEQWFAKLQGFKQRADEIESTYQHNINLAAEHGRTLKDEVFDALRVEIDQKANEVEKRMLENVSEVGKKVEKTNAEIVQMFGQMRGDVSLQRENAVKKLEEVRTEIEKSFELAIEESTQRLSAMAESNKLFQSDQEKSMQSFKSMVENSVVTVQSDVDSKISDIRSLLNNEARQLEDMFSVSKQENLKIFGDFKLNLGQKISKLDSDYISRIKSVEQSINEFEDAVSYKFNRMDSIVSEVGMFEAVMKDYMDSESGKLKSEFLRFEKQLEQERLQEVHRAEEVYAQFGNGVAKLENDLDELKKRAYDNVSSKLAVLEDEFFADIRTRSDKMEEKIADWQNSVAVKMNDVTSQVVKERQQMEAQYSESFASKIKELQGDISHESERLDSQVQRLSGLIDQRFTNAEQEVVRQREFIDQAIAELKDSSLNKFSTEFDEYQSNINSKISSYESKVKDRFALISGEVETKNDELVRILETAKSDMTIWQSKVLQQLSESNSEINSKISDFKLQASDNIFEIQAEFQREKDFFFKESATHREAIANDLATVSSNIQKLEGELKLKTAEAVQDFKEKYSDILGQLDSRSATLLEEVSNETESFRKIASDTRVKVNTVREQLFGRIDEKTNILTVNLNELDKRMKNFVAQTKLFEKADEMKLRLKQDLDFLKEELDRLRVDKKEIKETDKNFQKMKKMEEELNIRLNELLAQRRKVDEMEKDFTRLMETSNAISAKLDDVTSGSDVLHNIQAKLRQVEDIIAEVDRKYVRLEHKEGLLDSTAQGIDRNFQQMETMEGRVKQLESNFSQFLLNLKNSSDRIAVLAKNKPDADVAIEKISSLDNLLNDIDQRMDKMQKARAWLAETETRLDQINKSAQENVKLFKTLVESDAAKDARDRAPQADTRALVKKLAHQGWSISEIAKTTKLSRGEVELILELIPE